MRRQQPVLRGASLTLHQGEVVGLVGENGSGQSTLMKILVGALSANAGVVARTGRLGYCPQQPLVYGRLTCDEHFELFGGVFIAFLLPFLDLAIVQSPMLHPTPTLLARLLRGYGGSRTLLDGALTKGLDEGLPLLVGLAWLIALGTAVTLVYGRLVPSPPGVAAKAASPPQSSSLSLDSGKPYVVSGRTTTGPGLRS